METLLTFSSSVVALLYAYGILVTLACKALDDSREAVFTKYLDELTLALESATKEDVPKVLESLELFTRSRLNTKALIEPVLTIEKLC